MEASLWLSYGLCISFSILVISASDFSIIDYGYSPPPPPSLPPLPPSSISCQDDLKGIGSLNDSCQINTSLNLENDLYIEGTGNLEILPGVVLSCAISGCNVGVNISGDFSLGQNSSLVAGTIVLIAMNVSLHDGSLINTTGLAGAPPAKTSGSPLGIDGAGGGHGGRGACCLRDKEKLQEDVWGGDTYSWLTLTLPWSYGSKGGTTSREEEYGGGGGGRIGIEVEGLLEVNGTVSADGGEGGLKGGGGSGGSIYIKAQKM